MGGKKDSRPPKGSAADSKDGKPKKGGAKSKDQISQDGKTPKEKHPSITVDGKTITIVRAVQTKDPKPKKNQPAPSAEECIDFGWDEKAPIFDPDLKGQKAKICHILCAKEQKLNQARARLEAGDSWKDVVEKYSEDKKGNSGFLGDIVLADKTKFYAEFRHVASKTPVSTEHNHIYTICKTDEGYHMIRIDGRS